VRDTITDQQRLAILRIKDVWHKLPVYPEQVSGREIYTAVLRDRVRTPEQFGGWLAANGFPGSDGLGLAVTRPEAAAAAAGLGYWKYPTAR
jgi:hypothetical protein